MDRYQSFKDLIQHESAYRIEVIDHHSPITIMAPHGGEIEPHTSEIARLIAANQYNFYSFNGQRSSDNRRLHITSHLYDEEQALLLVSCSEFVVTVHGCTRKEPVTFIGGLHEEMKLQIKGQLKRSGIPAELCINSKSFSGRHPLNICNRGKLGRGVQLEISRGLRDNPVSRLLLAKAVRQAMSEQTAV